jgi:cytochrome b subunit of formate dehydrogenase
MIGIIISTHIPVTQRCYHQFFILCLVTIFVMGFAMLQGIEFKDLSGTFGASSLIS